MPDNANAPGSAPAGAGQPNAGQASPAGGAAGSGTAPAKDPLTARLESLANTVETIAKSQTELRSLHDRQMNELRSTLTATAARRPAARTATDIDDDDDGGAAGNGRGNVRDPEFEQDVALIKFRQLNPDWADYWPEMEPILLDRTRAAPFAVYRGSGQVDFYRSIQAVRDHLELLKLRKSKTDFDASRTNADATRATLKRDAAISGSGAASIEDIPDWSRLTPREKMRKAYELGFITDAEIDMENPPEALRDLVPKR